MFASSVLQVGQCNSHGQTWLNRTAKTPVRPSLARSPQPFPEIQSPAAIRSNFRSSAAQFNAAGSSFFSFCSLACAGFSNHTLCNPHRHFCCCIAARHSFIHSSLLQVPPTVQFHFLTLLFAAAFISGSSTWCYRSSPSPSFARAVPNDRPGHPLWTDPSQPPLRSTAAIRINHTPPTPSFLGPR